MYVYHSLSKVGCILICYFVITSVLLTNSLYAQQPIVDKQSIDTKKSIETKDIFENIQLPTIWDLKSQLLPADYNTALRALNDALNEIPDNVTYTWSREGSRLKGRIRPTSVFRDNDGRLCRHIVYALSLAHYTKQIESIACRDLNGNWTLSG